MIASVRFRMATEYDIICRVHTQSFRLIEQFNGNIKVRFCGAPSRKSRAGFREKSLLVRQLVKTKVIGGTLANVVR